MNVIHDVELKRISSMDHYLRVAGMEGSDGLVGALAGELRCLRATLRRAFLDHDDDAFATLAEYLEEVKP